MPKAPNEKCKEALQLYRDGEKLIDIARKLDVPAGTVRRWKSEYDWEGKKNPDIKKENERSDNTANDTNTADPNARKRMGAPIGNKNAVGNKGGAPKGNKNRFKHGLYEEIYWDTLDETEREMVQAIHDAEEETLLIEQIQLISVRERRLLRRIEDMRNASGNLSLESIVTKTYSTKESSVKNDSLSQTETTTKAISAFDVIQKLEAELTRIQGKKTRCIEMLGKLRTSKLNESSSEMKIAAQVQIYLPDNGRTKK